MPIKEAGLEGGQGGEPRTMIEGSRDTSEEIGALKWHT